MLRMVSVTACCSRCLGKHPPSLAEPPRKLQVLSPSTSLFCASQGSAPTPPPASVSHTQNPPLNSVRDAHRPSFPERWGYFCRKNTEHNSCGQPGASHPPLYKGGSSQSLQVTSQHLLHHLLTGVIAQHCPPANAPPPLQNTPSPASTKTEE